MNLLTCKNWKKKIAIIKEKPLAYVFLFLDHEVLMCEWII